MKFKHFILVFSIFILLAYSKNESNDRKEENKTEIIDVVQEAVAKKNIDQLINDKIAGKTFNDVVKDFSEPDQVIELISFYPIVSRMTIGSSGGLPYNCA